MIRGIGVVIIGVILNVLETWYFGWDLLPGSTLEGFADLTCALIMVFGYIMFTLEYKRRINRVETMHTMAPRFYTGHQPTGPKGQVVLPKNSSSVQRMKF
ncbi:hypothetical protein [uncultured Brevibacillus sp.]|uniref:hypothetical protein n=1 Tax=uncultured Brevibacillus sp. TaxID=169970 RepID=UPI00259960B5|nr:hypothetical protein [uncultured Brevibacillus sp.]